MKNIDDILNFLINNTEWNSDYKIGKGLLGYGNTAQVSGWRRRVAFPSNRDLIKMCEAAKIDLGEAVRAVEYSREYERPLREAGFIDLNVLLGMSAASFGALTLLKMSHLPYDSITAWILSSGSLYIM